MASSQKKKRTPTAASSTELSSQLALKNRQHSSGWKIYVKRNASRNRMQRERKRKKVTGRCLKPTSPINTLGLSLWSTLRYGIKLAAS